MLFDFETTLQLIKFFEELRYGKKDEGPEGLYYDRTTYEEDDDLYFDRSKYGHGYQNRMSKVKVTKQQSETSHVTFDIDKVRTLLICTRNTHQNRSKAQKTTINLFLSFTVNLIVCLQSVSRR